MSSPASDLPQLELMRHGVDYKFPLKCRSLSFKARPLTNLEIVMVNVAVATRLDDMEEKFRLEVTRSLLLAQEMLRAASSSDVGATDSPLTDYILERMTPDETQFLYKQYLAGAERVNPMLEMLPIETLNQMVEAVKKSPEKERVSTLIELSFSDLVGISELLLSREELQAANSSG